MLRQVAWYFVIGFIVGIFVGVILAPAVRQRQLLTPAEPVQVELGVDEVGNG